MLAFSENVSRKAEAEKISYQPQQEKISLQGRAKLHQGANVFEGENIQYDLKHNVLNASGASANNPDKASSSQRVKMVLPPALAK